jgi:uncharacterized protein YdeI (BOF family)
LNEKINFISNIGIIIDKWFGLQATPTTKITIHGDIDKELNYTKIDVDRVSLAQ